FSSISCKRVRTSTSRYLNPKSLILRKRSPPNHDQHPQPRHTAVPAAMRYTLKAESHAKRGARRKTVLHSCGKRCNRYRICQADSPRLRPQPRTPVDKAWREHRPSQEASANSGTDTRQATPDRRGVGRIYGSLGGLVLGEGGEGAIAPFILRGNPRQAIASTTTSNKPKSQ
ncbi:MAG: hypothetical protein ACYT04_31825, partial [Nostoc sp.]